MSSKPSETYMLKRTELLVITNDSDLLAVVKEAAVYYAFNTEFITDVFLAEAVVDKDGDVDADEDWKASPQVVFISLLMPSSIDEKVKAMAKLKSSYPRSQIILAISGGEPVENYKSLQEAGADRLIFDHEVKFTSKFFYLCSMLVHGTYLPIQVSDLFPSTQVGFNAYHKLPINQKFLPVIFAGFIFSDKKYRRLEPVKQVYVRREDLNEYRKYIESFHDNRGNALKKRCRATMMSLMGIYTELVVLLSLEAESNNQNFIKFKLEQYHNIVRDLAAYLKDCPDVWNVIFQALDFQFCRQERGPSILAYALLIAQKTEPSAIENIALGVLFADLGILDLPSSCYRQLVTEGEARLTPEEKDEYQHHPEHSLARVSKDSLVVSQVLKDILTSTHERADGKGFPNHIAKEKISFEAQLIHFCETLDRRTRANLEDGMVTHDFVRKQLWEEEKVSLACFNEDFLDKIEITVVTPVA
ncbi:MAG: hypothetical protein IPM97_00910 [Bdellovibrionaceae bacterium]|nr:hypothetical protein [Pseudobdellovibrionaceae bacterium]